MKTPEPAVLSGDRVRLEPLDERHRDDLAAAAAADPAAFTLYGPVFYEGGIDGWMRAALAERDSGSRFPFTVIDAASGRAIGSSSYLDIAPVDRRIEIGHTWYGGPWHGSGLNPEAKLLLLDHAFDDLGAIRVAFKCDAQNERSRRGIVRIGGTFEGVLRKHSLRGDASGTQRDTAYFSIIDDEWPEVRARLVALKDR